MSRPGTDATVKYANFKEFWHFYLSVHTHLWTQRLHVIGTSAGVLAFLAALFWNEPLWIPLALVLGYGFAWFSHFVIERNRPATFQYPVWSFLADYKMTFVFLIGGCKAVRPTTADKPRMGAKKPWKLDAQ
jgi:hypothetical protein